MPLLSKAKCLGEQGRRPSDLKQFTYREIETVETGAATRQEASHPGTDLLWAEPAEAPAEDSGNMISLEEMQAREEQARHSGLEEGEARVRASFEGALAVERSGLAAALSEFAKGRQAYYQKIEDEVVRLVLSIARKVLHRESQLDPMLLTGVVRVALEKMASGAVVELRVPPTQVDAWRAAIRSISPHNLHIEISGDESLRGPRCLIVTEMGRTDASLEAQLGEIERGFLDLLSQRPANLPAASDSSRSDSTPASAAML